MGRLSRPEELLAPRRSQSRRRRGALQPGIPAGLGPAERLAADAAQVAAQDRAIPSREGPRGTSSCRCCRFGFLGWTFRDWSWYPMVAMATLEAPGRSFWVQGTRVHAVDSGLRAWGALLNPA